MEMKDRIRQLRAGRQLSQTEFAAMIDCTKSQVAQWEVGNNYPKLENLIRIARAFDVTTDWLIMGIQERTTRSEAGTVSPQVADVWKDVHIHYLKERIEELESIKKNTDQLRQKMESLQEFVLEQMSAMSGADYQQLRSTLNRKTSNQRIRNQKLPLSGYAGVLKSDWK